MRGINITTGNIIEENHYYAYGLKIAAISSKKLGDNNEGNLQNNYQYQGEFNEMDADIGWNDFALRNYDPQVGRWVQQDPYQEFASPYVGMDNDPIVNIDPSGGNIFAGISLGGKMVMGAIAGGVAGIALDAAFGGDGAKGGAIGTIIGALAPGVAQVTVKVAISMGLHAVVIAGEVLKSTSTTLDVGNMREQNKGGNDNLNGINQGSIKSLDVKVDGKKVGVIDIKNFYIGVDKYGRNGVVIELLYKSINTAFKKFNWIQTIRSNALNLSMDRSPYNDAGEEPPFYYSEEEIKEQDIPVGYNAKFLDNPDRYTNPAKDIFLEGELSLVGVNSSGVYQEMITITYGFKLSRKGELARQDIRVQKASAFQLYSISHAFASFLGRIWKWWDKNFFSKH